MEKWKNNVNSITAIDGQRTDIMAINLRTYEDYNLWPLSSQLVEMLPHTNT